MKSKRLPQTDLDTIIPILIGVWRRIHKEAGPADRLQTREFRRVIASIKVLEEMHDGKQSLIGQDYFKDPDLLTAYLLYHWVVHYQQGLSLINEIPLTPKRVLDVGSGPLPFAFAALRHGAKEVIATDQNLTALQLGADVCGRYGMPVTIRKWNCLTEHLPVEGTFDLIILGHCLLELFPSTAPNYKQNQQAFISTLIKRLTPSGFLLIADNSYLEANQQILQLRDALVEIGIPVQAPCVWKGPCPALQAKNSPCYAQREFEKPFLIKEIQRASDIKLSSLKMTYIIFRNPEAGWPQLPEKRLYRIISPPIESPHGNRYYLCGIDGKKNFGSHFEKQPPEAKAFDYLKRGELIAIENPLEHGNHLNIVKGTKVTIEAACNKPLKEIDQNQDEKLS